MPKKQLSFNALFFSSSEADDMDNDNDKAPKDSAQNSLKIV